MRHITRHIIHCSDSTHGDVEEIRRWHIERGWNDIGYHFVITRRGDLEWGRPLELPGAHCRGHNRDSIGTCLIGKHAFTQTQFVTLRRLHRSLSLLFPGITAHGHREFTPYKTCPNFEVTETLGHMEESIHA